MAPDFCFNQKFSLKKTHENCRRWKSWERGEKHTDALRKHNGRYTQGPRSESQLELVDSPLRCVPVYRSRRVDRRTRARRPPCRAALFLTCSNSKTLLLLYLIHLLREDAGGRWAADENLGRKQWQRHFISLTDDRESVFVNNVEIGSLVFYRTIYSSPYLIIGEYAAPTADYLAPLT